MNVHQNESRVPFDDRLERVLTVTEDGEVIGIEYRFCEQPEEARVADLRPALIYVLLVCLAVLLVMR